MAGIEIRAGRLSKNSRLYRHLTDPHRTAAMHISRHPEIVLCKLSGSHDVFLMKDDKSGREFVLKSFAERSGSSGRPEQYLDNEYDCLKHIRKIGVDGRHWQVARPICRDRKALFLVEKKADGKPLDHRLLKEITGTDRWLKEKLDLLAGFFASLHRKTATRQRVNVSSILKELQRHATQSHRAGGLGIGELHEARSLARRWCDSPSIRHATRSLTHGDATTANFIYKGDHLTVIDLERSKCRDPVYDLGMMAGELFGAALSAASNPYVADRYIHRLYWKYAGNFEDRHGIFSHLTARNPFYMANSLLRMSRNDYFSEEHRRKLAFYALECLRSIGHGRH
jgi:aminoglycoside phosphotransferase (APT) family kinase protein